VNTIRVISVEGYKAARSRIWLASLLIGTMAPLLMGLGFLLRRDNLIKNGIYTWTELEQNALIFFVLMLGAAMVGGLAGLAITDETRFNTLKGVLTSGVTRSQYLFGKLFFVYLWVIVEMAVFTVTTFLVGFALGLNPPHMGLLATVLLVETAWLLALVPFFLFIALFTNNFFIAGGAGVAFAFVSLLLNFFGSGREYIGYFPGSAGSAYALVITNQFGAKQYEQPLAWTIVLVAFSLASLVATWVVMQRRDIQ